MIKERISKDDYYLEIAKSVSLRSTCLRRQYGCVIVNADEIVSTGFNGSPRGALNCCDTGVCHRLGCEHNCGSYDECMSVHAEQNAMISASRKEMIGATLYLVGTECDVDLEDCMPCHICRRMIANSGIERIVTRRTITYVKTGDTVARGE